MFDDGWYCTGDSGKFDENGNLWVTGRISEVFKTSKGKFIVPMRLEDLFGRSPLLAQFCVMGHGRDQPILLTTLSKTGSAMDRESVKVELETPLDEVNAEVPSHEKVGQIHVTPEWTIENPVDTHHEAQTQPDRAGIPRADRAEPLGRARELPLTA